MENSTTSPAHTQGPWTFTFVEPAFAEAEGEAYRIQTEAPTHPDLASVFYRDGQAESEANACLMAAAPELLAACKSASVAFEERLSALSEEKSWRGDDEYQDMLGNYTYLKTQTDAAIAQAQGRNAPHSSE
jgi:hypothetical protein